MRTDYILLAPLFAWALHSPPRRLETALALGTAALVYLAINTAFGYPGYLAMFNYSFIQGCQPYPAEMPVSTDLSDYLSAYAAGAQKLIASPSLWLALLGALLAFAALRTDGWRRPSLPCFTLAATAFMLAHFALYPAGHDRFYIATLALSLAMLFTQSHRLAALARSAFQTGGQRI